VTDTTAADPAPLATPESAGSSGGGGFARAVAPWLYPLTVFVSAVLLFTLQPLFAKLLTPKMGGTPSVWNTALVFYQAALLVGYLYAHLLATRCKPRTQLIVHAVVLVAGLVFLPVRISGLVGEPDVEAPVLWTFAALTLSIGVPIAAISATAPLVQAWRARLGDTVDPYRLYAASNLGSFSALAAYPFVIEPLLGAQAQSWVWMGLYAVLGAMLVTAIAAVPQNSAAPREVAEQKTSWGERATWVLFAAPPSALLVAVTTHITTDVASVPLLWIPPLALYLLTFVVAFSAAGDRVAEGAGALKLLAVFLLAVVMAAGLDSGIPGLFIHAGAFFLIVLACHLELAKRRPEPARLTEFYLWMSFGGVLGGAATALLAPVLLNTTLEYQIALAAALAVGVWRRADLPLAGPAALIAGLAAMWYIRREDLALWFAGNDPDAQAFWLKTLVVYNWDLAGVILVAVCAFAATLAMRSALLVAVIGGIGLVLPALNTDGPYVQLRERSFFGVLEVEDSGTEPDDWRYLSHGTTLHGQMSLDPARQNEPTSYYYRLTPIGSLFEEASNAKPTDLHAGVVGLGTGTSACYARPGQSWTFYEIDEDVVRVAMDPRYFGMVPRCAPQARIILGDARLKIMEQQDKWYDILLIDAFSSDAIPTHLITREAIASYMEKVADDGIMIVHISNRYLDLTNIVAEAAHSLGYAAMIGDRGGAADNEADTGVRVVAIAKNVSRLLRYQPPVWTLVPQKENPRPWTDDRTDIVRAIIEHAD
jgi:hypothetical protein